MNTKRFQFILSMLICIGSNAQSNVHKQHKTTIQLNDSQPCPKTTNFTPTNKVLYPDSLNQQMKTKYNAIPCTNQKLLEQFDAMQNELNIYPKIPLYVTYLPSINNYQNFFKACAWCTRYPITVTINAWQFYTQSEIQKKQTLYHELRHVFQFTTCFINPNGQPNAQLNKNPLVNETYKRVKEIENIKKLTNAKAIEYDADEFGIQRAAQSCPFCIKEIRRRTCIKFIPFSYTIDNSSKGYFGWKDFDNALQQANQHPNICDRHATKTGLLKFYISEYAYRSIPLILYAAVANFAYLINDKCKLTQYLKF